MASVGPVDFASFESSAVGVVGGSDWTNPTNAAASDDSRATVSANSSKSLRAYAPALDALPDDGEVTGIKLEVERSNSGARGAADRVVKLSKDGTSVVGDDKADTSTSYPGTDAYKVYGGDGDMWGTTWTPAELKAATFSALFSMAAQAGKGFPTVRVDHMRITVYYTEAEAASPTGQVAATPLFGF
jgi:hypothetical protein